MTPEQRIERLERVVNELISLVVPEALSCEECEILHRMARAEPEGESDG